MIVWAGRPGPGALCSRLWYVSFVCTESVPLVLLVLLRRLGSLTHHIYWQAVTQRSLHFVLGGDEFGVGGLSLCQLFAVYGAASQVLF